MADDRDARIAQLEAEVLQLRGREAAAQREIAALRERDTALAEEGVRRDRALAASQQREAALHDQVTATASILHVVAARPADATAVLQTIVDTAARLCQCDNVGINRIVGDEFERVANFNGGIGPLEIGTRRPVIPDSWSGRAVFERRTVRHDDLDAIVDVEYPGQAPTYRQHSEERGLGTGPIRSLLVIPLLREHYAIGTLVVTRYVLRPFTDQQIALLETFADQAVIAIENARLFAELEQRNAELQDRTTELSQSLDQQTALSEVLQ